MDIIAFILTTDGGDREDGNVYYSSILLVQGTEADRPAVCDIIATFTGGKVDHHGFTDTYRVEYDRYTDNDEPNPLDDYVGSWDNLTNEERRDKIIAGESPTYEATGQDSLCKALAAAGFTAEFVGHDYIIGS